jgi:hypothetical protein
LPTAGAGLEPTTSGLPQREPYLYQTELREHGLKFAGDDGADVALLPHVLRGLLTPITNTNASALMMATTL